MISSTPNFAEFNPDIIPYQRSVIDFVKNKYDYNNGTLEILLSGAVGSAKSIILAHLAIFHCLAYSNARILVGRRALPDLKETIFKKIIEHLDGVLTEGKDFWINQTTCKIEFRNGSEIISKTWADKNYKKFRSLELSAAIIEELTENREDDKQAYDEIKMRVGRLSHINEKFIISATNPDSPSHWVYKYFIESQFKTRKVFYSITTDNPFLPESYVKQLKEELDPKLAQRMIYGQWVDINEEIIYYAYERDYNFKQEAYSVNERFPIFISWDFNIGEGKPLSCVLFQFIDDTLHIFDEVVVHGMRTGESCDELSDRGLLNYNTKYILTGDAAGRSRDTRNNRSDYDIIKLFFSNYMVNNRIMNFQMYFKLSNPPVRSRHNLVNSYCLNSNGKRRLFVYSKAKVCDEGLRLSRLKKGGNYIEDDSKHYQHITTALGYGLACAIEFKEIKPQGTMRL